MIINFFLSLVFRLKISREISSFNSFYCFFFGNSNIDFLLGTIYPNLTERAKKKKLNGKTDKGEKARFKGSFFPLIF